MSTLAEGTSFAIWRAASKPFSSGIARSWTTTSGLSLFASRTDSVAICRFTDNLDICLFFQEKPQSFSNHGVIVRQ